MDSRIFMIGFLIVDVNGVYRRRNLRIWKLGAIGWILKFVWGF